MLQIIRDVAAFHRAGEVPVKPEPGFPSQDRVDLRVTLIEEETRETIEAIRAGDLVEVADGTIYILAGTALELGIDLTAVWNEVQRSNMSKFPPCEHCGGTGFVSVAEEHDRHCHHCNGRGTQLRLREDGKVLKPEGWTPPDIASVLGV